MARRFRCYVKTNSRGEKLQPIIQSTQHNLAKKKLELEETVYMCGDHEESIAKFTEQND